MLEGMGSSSHPPGVPVLSRLTLRLALPAVALCVLWGDGASRAAPNPACPGWCEGQEGSRACGSANDCGAGSACVFEEGCWPGLSSLIVEAVADYAGGIGDPTAGWVCHELECAPSDGQLTLRGVGRGGSAQKHVSLLSGRRYVLRASVAVSRGAHASVEVRTGAEQVRSAVIVGPQEGQLVTLEFSVPSGLTGRVEVRLDVGGEGAVSLWGAAFLVAERHGVHLRFRGEDGRVGLSLRNTDIWRFVEGQGPYHHSGCATDYRGHQPCLSVGRFSVVTGEDGWTPWLDWASLVGGETTALHRILVEAPLGTGPPPAIQAEVAWAEDPEAVVYRGQSEGGVGSFLLALPESGQRAGALLRDTGFAVDALLRDRAALAPRLEALPPRSYAALPMVGGGADDLGAGYARAAFELAAALGHGRFAYGELGVEAAGEGEDELAWVVPVHDWIDALEGPDGEGAAWEPARLDQRFGAWLDAHPIAEALASAGPAEIIADLGPSRWVPWVGPAYVEGYRRWLGEASASPGALGLERLDEAEPLQGEHAEEAESMRPLRQEAHAARRWGWALRYLSQTTLEAYRSLSRVLRARGVSRVQVDLGSVFAPTTRGFGRGPDAHELAEGGRFDSFIVSHGRRLDGDCRGWEVSALAAWARAHASPSFERASFTGGAFELGLSHVPDPGRDPHSTALQMAIAGFGHVRHEGYGPAPFGGAEVFGGRGEESLAAFHHLLDLNRTFGAARDALEGAALPRSPVVIFGAQSDLRWVDVPAITEDELGWYAMLTHAGWPIEVVAEGEIGLGLLERPDQGRVMMILLRRHVSRAAWGVIERWVEAGGHLVTSADLPIFDEFGQLVLSRAAWFGIDAASHGTAPGSLTSFRWQTTDGSVTFQSDVPWQEVLSLSGSVIARTESDRSVAVRFSRGRGRVTVSGIPLGQAYLAPVRLCEASEPRPLGRVVTGWSEALRRAADAAVQVSGLRVDAVVKTPGVELRSLGTAQRPLLAVMTHQRRPLSFLFEARRLQRCRSLRDLLGGADGYVNLGAVLASVQGAALVTWDPASCDVEVITPRPDQPVEVEPEPELIRTGCGGAGSAGSLLGLLILAALGLARRRSV